MRLSVIIPVFNEAGTLEELLSRVMAVDVGMERQIVIVDDGSCDGTREIYPRIQRRWPDQGIVIKLQALNKGKGAASARGVQAGLW